MIRVPESTEIVIAVEQKFHENFRQNRSGTIGPGLDQNRQYGHIVWPSRRGKFVKYQQSNYQRKLISLLLNQLFETRQVGLQ